MNAGESLVGIDFRPGQNHVQAAGDLGDFHGGQTGSDQPQTFISPIADILGKSFGGEKVLRGKYHIASFDSTTDHVMVIGSTAKQRDFR